MIALVVLALVLVILMVRAHQRKQDEAAEFGRGRPGGQGGPVAVTIATAKTGDIDVRIPALGTVTPLATVTVRPQISGQLQKVAFTEGQLVKEGDFLAEIDPRPYEATLNQAIGSLKRDQALLADARLNLQRFEELIKEDSVAQQELDTQRSLVHQYEGTVDTDEAAIKAAKVNLAYTHIVSPVNGRVGLRQVDQGNYVTPGDTNGLVVVTELQPITVIFAIPEDNVPAIMQRVQAGATLMVEAYDRSNSTRIAEGKLLTLDNVIDTTTGTIKLRAQFDNKNGALFPNQFVNIQLLQNTLHDQILMPTAAVQRGAPNGVTTTFVYLVNRDSTVAVRPVTLGVQSGETVSVTEGLAAGDIVVTEGGDRLRDGATVQLPGAAPPSPMAAGGRKQGGGSGSHRRQHASNAQ